MRKALLFLFVTVAIQLAGQTLPPIPERLVNIDCNNKRTDEVLKDIAQQGKFEFAWDAQLFDPSKPVTLHVQNVSVRRAIYLIFGNAITFRVKGNYVVLVAAPPPLTASAPPPRKAEFTISGYVIDSASYVIPHTSIYDSVSLSATLSDQFGYYELKLAAGTQPVRVKVSREKYVDTFIVVTPSSNITMDIVMRKIPPAVVIPVVSYSASSAPDTIANPGAEKINSLHFLDSLIGFEQVMQSRNLRETLRNTGQVSLLPFLSTNGMMTGAVSNKYSFNVIGGYTGGTSVAEIGGVFNIDRGNVQWIQAAGAFNVTGGNTRGVQMSGALNTTFGKMNGLQLTGGSNFLFDSLTGVQLAGGSNFIDGHVNGFQFAGGTNIASRDLDGMQIAGGANITLGSMNRLQASGGMNYAGKVSGVQVAAGLNLCIDSMRGAQVAVLNIAQDVNGMQVGIVNYARSYDGGAPIGLISIVVHGLHELEIASTERGFLNFALRTGTPGFYNVLNFGCDPSQADTFLWTFGYGIGHRFSIHPKFDVAIDLDAHHVNKGKVAAFTNEWLQLSVTAEWRPFRAFAVAAGPVLNYYITGAQQNQLIRFQQTPFYTGTAADGYRTVAWVGATFAIRFL